MREVCKTEKEKHFVGPKQLDDDVKEFLVSVKEIDTVKLERMLTNAIGKSDTELITHTITVEGDGFRVMLYQCNKCKSILPIWNSRPFVTPFGILCRYTGCSGTMFHKSSAYDVYELNYNPPPCSWVFVDLTRERAEEIATRYVEKYWNHERDDYRMSERWETKEEAIKELSNSYLAQGGEHTPDLITAEVYREKYEKEYRNKYRPNVAD